MWGLGVKFFVYTSKQRMICILASLAILIHFAAVPHTALAQANPQATYAQAQSKKSQPALVRPPDILTEPEDPSHPSVKADNTKKTNPEDIKAPTEKIDSALKAAEEPVPQIKRKTDLIDSSFRPERRLIEHPNASKGLIKIDKDRIYHYKVKTSDQDSAGTFQLGSYQPLDLTNPNNSSLTFDTMYDEASFPLLLYDYEKQFFKKFGRLGWKLGGGFYYARGNGEFAEDNPSPEGPSETFTLFIFPINAGLIYRFQYFDYQWLVPYAEGGLDIFAFAERRDDNLNPPLGAAYGAAPAAHASGGVAVLLGRGATSFLDLDREYGINKMYLTAQYRLYFALSDKFDFSGDAITGGITAEY